MLAIGPSYDDPFPLLMIEDDISGISSQKLLHGWQPLEPK